jgi:hypothetical protein
MAGGTVTLAGYAPVYVKPSETTYPPVVVPDTQLDDEAWSAARHDS